MDSSTAETRRSTRKRKSIKRDYSPEPPISRKKSTASEILPVCIFFFYALTSATSFVLFILYMYFMF